MPGFPVPAFQHGLSQKLMYGAMYTFVHNAIDVPTAAIPISQVKKSEQNYTDLLPEDIMTQSCKQAMTDSKDLPLAIQVSTLPYQDEECMLIMKHFESMADWTDKIPVKDIDFEKLQEVHNSN